MTPRSFILLLALVLLVGPVRAQKQAFSRGSGDPSSSGNWQDPEKQLKKVFDKLLSDSGLTNTQLLYRKDYRDAAGTPAAAMQAKTGPNKTDHDIVFVGYGIFELCRDEDELAFILGHELAHLVLKHPEQSQAHALKLLEKWSAKQDLSKFKDDAAMIKAAEAAIAPGLGEFQKGQEREADKEGLSLARLAGYQAKSASSAMEHAQDWVWATTDGTPDTTHDPLPKRVHELRQLALAMEDQKKKFADAGTTTGGLKASAEGLASGDAGQKSGKMFDGNSREHTLAASAAAGAAPLVGAGKAGAGALADAGSRKVEQGYAFEAVKPPDPAPAKLESRMKDDKKLKEFYGHLSTDEKNEFNKIYETYSGNVEKRKGEGWNNGMWGNFKVNRTRGESEQNISKASIDAEAQRLETDSIPRMEARIAASSSAKDREQMGRDLAQSRTRLAEVKALQSKKWGLCTDWAYDNETVLRNSNGNSPYFEVNKITRGPFAHDTALFGGYGQHSAVEIKRRYTDGSAVVLDPWSSGQPDLVTKDSWLESSYLHP